MQWKAWQEIRHRISQCQKNWVLTLTLHVGHEQYCHHFLLWRESRIRTLTSGSRLNWNPPRTVKRHSSGRQEKVAHMCCPSHPVCSHFLPGHRFASREGLLQEGGHLRTRSNVLRLEFPEKTISLIPILSPFLQLKKGTWRGAPRTWVPAQSRRHAVANTCALQTAWDNFREALESPKATYIPTRGKLALAMDLVAIPRQSALTDGPQQKGSFSSDLLPCRLGLEWDSSGHTEMTWVGHMLRVSYRWTYII